MPMTDCYAQDGLSSAWCRLRGGHPGPEHWTDAYVEDGTLVRRERRWPVMNQCAKCGLWEGSHWGTCSDSPLRCPSTVLGEEIARAHAARVSFYPVVRLVDRDYVEPE